MGFIYRKTTSSPPPRIKRPVPENVSGDWFVAADCCTLCNVPSTVAPDMFEFKIGPKGEEYCYVRRQPVSKPDLDQMLEVVGGAEFQCVRYVGKDPAIIDRLRGIGQESVMEDNDSSGRA